MASSPVEINRTYVFLYWYVQCNPPTITLSTAAAVANSDFLLDNDPGKC